MATICIIEGQEQYHEVETLFYDGKVWKVTTKSGLKEELDCVQFINNSNSCSQIYVDLKEHVIILPIPATLIPLTQRRKLEKQRLEQEEKDKQEAKEKEESEMLREKIQREKRAFREKQHQEIEEQMKKNK